VIPVIQEAEVEGIMVKSPQQKHSTLSNNKLKQKVWTLGTGGQALAEQTQGPSPRVQILETTKKRYIYTLPYIISQH
jgi:hypothetical protein